jgi:hypothetical protein
MHLNLIRQIAWSFSTSTGLEYSDLYSEGCLCWLENEHLWNKSKGKITTFMWWIIQSGLKNFVAKQNKYKAPLKELTSTSDKPMMYIPYLEKLSFEAVFIAKLVIKNPECYLYTSKKEAIKTIEKCLISRGWEKERINEGFKQLENSF